MELHGVRMTDVRPVAGGLFIGYDAGAGDPRRMLGEPTARLFFKRARRGESGGLFRGYTSKWHRRNGAPCWRVTALGARKPGGPLEKFVRSVATRERAEALLVRKGCQLNGIEPPKPARRGPAATLADRERDAMLAGLRLLQREFARVPSTMALEVLDIYTNGNAHKGLQDDEIDALCERLNVATS